MRRFCLVLLLLLDASATFCCTSVIVGADASANGRPLLWKQRDTPARFNYVDNFAAREGCFAFTGLVNATDTLRNEVWCGTNAVGFSVMNTVAYGLSPIIDENRPWEGIVMKRALEVCVTVDDFEAYISSLPQPNGLETNFGVSDADGDAAYFEVHDLGYVRFDVPRDGYLIRTNYAMTGREGEGKGYDRYELVEAKMKAHKGKFDACWILRNLSREDIVARPTSVASLVMDGQMLWCVAGYSRAAYAIPVEALGEIPSPLRYPDGLGCEANLLADTLKTITRDTPREAKIDRMVRQYERKEFRAYRNYARHSAKSVDDSALWQRYEAGVAARFEAFRRRCLKSI